MRNELEISLIAVVAIAMVPLIASILVPRYYYRRRGEVSLSDVIIAIYTAMGIETSVLMAVMSTLTMAIITALG